MASDPNPQQRVMPTLRMTDYERSKDFYVAHLGFQIDWEHRFEPGFPVFMQVSRDGLAFFLTEHTGDCPVGGLIHLYVPDVDAWFGECRQKGVPGTGTAKRVPAGPAEHDNHGSGWKQASHLHAAAGLATADRAGQKQSIISVCEDWWPPRSWRCSRP